MCVVGPPVGCVPTAIAPCRPVANCEDPEQRPGRFRSIESVYNVYFSWPSVMRVYVVLLDSPRIAIQVTVTHVIQSQAVNQLLQ